MTANPYRTWVETFRTALIAGNSILAAPVKRTIQQGDRPAVLIFSPHPDDEVIIGGLALRLMRELGFAVVNVAVTLGSLPARRAERWRELQAACDYVGFGLVNPHPEGLDDINLEGRARSPEKWAASVQAITQVLAAHQPDIVFMPHAADWNSTHIGVHHLVVEAMRRLPSLRCTTVETEFWGAMATPNLMVELTSVDVADQVAALSLHVGEVARNAYHLRLPAWMIDNVRRGSELVGGQGGTAPAFSFATLYRLRGWFEGQFHDVLPHGVAVAAGDSLEDLFPLAKGN